MEHRWDEQAAAALGDDPLALRVYSSRLLGADPELVMHGGGNTSVKVTVADFFGGAAEVLYVKGSGWDLATIEAGGFAPVRLDVLRRLAALPALSDPDMVAQQRLAMLDPDAPNPSVEAILHALIPATFVDHTHADAVVTITNTTHGAARIGELYGSRVAIVPYVMPGFDLAKAVHTLSADWNWSALEGLVLLNHGIFTFGDSARQSYDRMIELVGMAEDYVQARAAGAAPAPAAGAPDLHRLAELRRAVSTARGAATLAVLDDSPAVAAFSRRADAARLVGTGPLTPDHVLRLKRTACVLGADAAASVADFAAGYHDEVARLAPAGVQPLDPAPRWVLWPGVGTVACDRTPKGCAVIGDIVAHTTAAMANAEALGGWQPLPSADVLAVEYWSLEQAKLQRAAAPPPLAGRIALVTGAAGGIGRACVGALAAQGAVVAAVDVAETVHELGSDAVLPLQADVTDEDQLAGAVAACVRRVGGLDMVVSNAGNFPPSATIAELGDDTWRRTLALNLDSHQRLLRLAVPYLQRGIDPAVVVVASKNVPAPGPGAAAYSVAKAGLTQLARVAALELGAAGVRVNVVHPNAVFDTGIWNDETLASRAAHYGLDVEAYKRNNVLGREVRATDVARLVCAMLGPAFACTTGAQVPIDGGNDRVI